MFSERQIQKLFHRMTQTPDELLNDNRSHNASRRFNWSGKKHDILAVAHVDYVIWNKPRKKGDIVTGGQVDDRVGVWLLMDILPALGLKYDLLLTNDEESGQSTASDFYDENAPDYNWAFQFDRAGTDCVQYHYSPYWEDILSHYFTVGVGTYSDCAEMPYEHLNVGCGYHGQHTKNAYVDLKECFLQVQRFIKFYNDMKDFELPIVDLYHVESHYGDNLFGDEYELQAIRTYR